MSLEEQLLSDYGTIPQKIGLYLLRNNTASLENIQKGTGLEGAELRDGLSILIQRRFVKFFIFEKTIKYHIDRQMLKRRLYFPIYANYIADSYSAKHLKFFTRVLTCGIFKITEESEYSVDLLRDRVFQTEVTRTNRARAYAPFEGHGHGVERTDDDIKIHKTSIRYLIVNYTFLDSKIFEIETAKFVSKKYNEAASEVFKAVLKCDQINKPNIIKNLASTKILLLDNGAIINDKNNIDEYLRYLCDGNVLCQGADQNRAYFFRNNTKQLKMYRINLMIANPACRRLFNMIVYKGEIPDKSLTVNSLLSINKIKETTFEMQRIGLIVQNCLEEYKGGNKMEHSWSIDLDFTSRLLIKNLEVHICKKMEQFNECWDVNYFLNNVEGNENVWISDIISLSTDHLILNMS